MKKHIILTVFFLVLIKLSLNAATDKYRLMFNSNPSREITIAWNQISGTGQTVYYGTTDYGTNWSSYLNNSAPYRSLDYLGMNNQFVKLTGLIPDTVYYFVINDSEGTSERYWFRTIPADNNERLSIISGGDSRFDTNIDSEINRLIRQNSNKMVAKLRPHVVIYGGDLIASPGREPDTMSKWLDDWQLTITSDNQIIPVVHSYGNHESDNPDGDLLTLQRLFDTPEDSYYNVKFGGDLFSYYVLNGELLPLGMENNDTKRVEQRDWLHNQLPVDNSIWKSAGYHRPISPHNSGKTPQKDSFNDWAKVFYDYGVRIVMESDAHLVKLTKEIKPKSAIAEGDDPENWFEMLNIEDDKGLTFIGGGSWSIIREDDISYSYTLARDSFYSFNLIFVDQNSIEIRTLDTQSPSTITERTEITRFDINSDVDAVTWKPSGLPTGVKIIAKYSDDDNDGVMNDSDTCPNTPSGETVDSNGCSDSQLDDDNDGVMNNSDTCPNTPSGETVDSNGCFDSQLDDDNDGVMNDSDTCPNTPSGETVDSNGCSDSQLDDDNDGVMNDSDTCPNTPSGETVDSNGCSDSQLDDDNDGVMNDSDTCPNTPSGETVDSNGCSDSQLDDDNDGVMNDKDQCPNTPNGETVNSDGCSDDQLLGVEDNKLDKSIKFYPNPVSNILSIKSETIPINKVEIYSILGQIVKEVNSDFNSISTDNLSRGIYLIRIYSEKGTTVRKLIKQ